MRLVVFCLSLIEFSDFGVFVISGFSDRFFFFGCIWNWGRKVFKWHMKCLSWSTAIICHQQLYCITNKIIQPHKTSFILKAVNNFHNLIYKYIIYIIWTIDFIKLSICEGLLKVGFLLTLPNDKFPSNRYESCRKTETLTVASLEITKAVKLFINGQRLHS